MGARNIQPRQRQQWRQPAALPGAMLCRRSECWRRPEKQQRLHLAAPKAAEASGVADAGWQCRPSSFGEEPRDLHRRDCPFADDAPTRYLVAEIDNGGGDVAGGCAAIHDNVNAFAEVIAHLLSTGALGSTAQVSCRSLDRNAVRSHYRQ